MMLFLKWKKLILIMWIVRELIPFRRKRALTRSAPGGGGEPRITALRELFSDGFRGARKGGATGPGQTRRPLNPNDSANGKIFIRTFVLSPFFSENGPGLLDILWKGWFNR